MELLGNLGNGFPADLAKGKKVFLIGGGVGIPPMVQLAKTIQGEKQIIVGYRNSETFLDKDLDRRGDLYIATEDGSLGTKGNVMDAIRENKLTADMIFACGPMPMLRAIKKYAEEAGIPAYISLEEHMACGIGACLGCVVKTAKKDPHSHVNNTRICTEGPVFEAQAAGRWKSDEYKCENCRCGIQKSRYDWLRYLRLRYGIRRICGFE